MRPRPITGEPISPRHRETLLLLANGHHNADIGRTLGVSVHTADLYVKQILARLGAVDRAHAVALAVRHGYLDVADIQPHPELPALEGS